VSEANTHSGKIKNHAKKEREGAAERGNNHPYFSDPLHSVFRIKESETKKRGYDINAEETEAFSAALSWRILLQGGRN